MKKLLFKNQKFSTSASFGARGIAPLIIIVIIAAVLAASGTAYILVNKKIPGVAKPPSAEVTGEPSEEKTAGVEKKLDELKVEVPGFDISLAPLPDLKISALNLSVPLLPAIKPLAGFSVSTDFSFGKDIQISAPVVEFKPTVVIPTGGPPTAAPSPGSTGAPSETPGPQVDCSVFASAPSCSYIGAPGSQAYELCKQCFPNK